jgi:tetratricopeptide (TPR) repeat protein/sugar lactone lactonase YvrE
MASFAPVDPVLRPFFSPGTFGRVIFLFIGCVIGIPAQGTVSLQQSYVSTDGQPLFEQLVAMAERDDGAILAADSAAGALLVFSNGETVRRALSGDGRPFGSRRLGGISLLPGQRVLLINRDEGGFAIVDDNDRLLLKQAEEGSAAGQLDEPAGVAWSSNRRMYIADTDNDRVAVFGDDGVFLHTLGQQGLPQDQRLRRPLQLWLDAAEQLYVFSRQERGEVHIFAADGALLKRLDHGQLEKMTGESADFSAMAIDHKGRLYLADSRNGRLYQLDWQGETRLQAFGSKGSERGQFQQVTALLALADGRLAVADSGNHRLDIYQLDEQPGDSPEQTRLPTVLHYGPLSADCDRAYRLSTGKALCFHDNKVSLLGLRGDLVKQLEGDFSRLTTAATDDRNIIIIDDNRIKIYNLDGEAQFQGRGYGGAGSADGKLDSPQGAYLRGDRIYIADTGNRRIQVYTRDGIFLHGISNPAQSEQAYFSEPNAVVVDAQQNMYVADRALGQILVFDAAGKLLYRLGDQQQQRSFDRVYDIAMDVDNNLYVLCATADSRYRIQVYHGPKKIIAFGAYSSGGAGIQQATNLSVAKSRKTIVSVYDKARKKLVNYSYLQVPARVSGVQVAGELQQTRLSWPPVPGSFIAGYNVYGAETADAEYRFLAKVVANEAVIQHNNRQVSLFYKVAAASGLGVESPLSRPAEDIFRTAYRHFNDQRYAEAAGLLAQTVEQHPQQPEALKYLGLSQLKLQRVDEAVASFRALSVIPGYEKPGMDLLVGGLLAAQQYIEAKAVLDQLIEQQAATTETYIRCGEVSLKLADPIGAVTCLEEVLKRDEKNIPGHFLMGEAYVKLGILDRGLAQFDTAAELAPDNADVWYRAGQVMQSLEKHQQAVEKFTRALQIDSKHTRANLGLAQSYLQLQRLDEVKNIAISLAGQPATAARGQYLLGLVALASKQHGEALLALTKSTRLDPHQADAWLALADAYDNMGQRDKLQGILQSAVAADAASFAAAYRLGEHEYASKNYAEAASALEQAVAIDAGHYQARLKLAEALLRQNELKRAADAATVARQIDGDSIEPLVLLSAIADRQGKTSAAIEHIKQAMGMQPNDFGLHLQLGELYVENNLFDPALPVLEKARLLDRTSALPHVLLGRLYSKRRLFDRAISAFDKAVALQPDPQYKLLLDTAYAEKKKSLDFASNAPQILLQDLRFKRVFSAAYKQYATQPVGSLRIRNTGASDYANLKLTFSIKGYMDFPASQEIDRLAANESMDIDLLASFNNRILDIDEDTGVQAEVALHFVRDGRDDAIRLTQPMTIYGKNAIVWGQPNMVGAFVTPKDDTLRDFVRQVINENRPEPGPLNSRLVTAMTLFDALSAHGIRYLVDPNNPYSKVQLDRVDYVQFGRETLKIKSGDCDDLSVLLSAGLENLGIETAIVDVPGHLLMMFNSGLPAASKDRISLQEDLLVVHDEQVWIPVEATMIGTSFAEAWAEGARKYHQYAGEKRLQFTELQQAWQTYQPVTLKPAAYSIAVPERARIAPLVSREQKILLQKSLDRLVRPYLVMVAADPENFSALMQVAIIYARYGLYGEADKVFDRILAAQPENSAVHNNRGNIYFAQGEFERALETYGYAEQLAANDPGIKINLAMAHYQLGQLNQARGKFSEAGTISAEAVRQYDGLGKLLSR